MPQVWMIVCGLMFAIGFAQPQCGYASAVEFKRSRGPGNAATLRQFYREMTALSADPALNGTLTLIS
jgi:hypothetical protein